MCDVRRPSTRLKSKHDLFHKNLFISERRVQIRSHVVTRVNEAEKYTYRSSGNPALPTAFTASTKKPLYKPLGLSSSEACFEICSKKDQILDLTWRMDFNLLTNYCVSFLAAVTFEAVSVKKIWKNDPVGASEP